MIPWRGFKKILNPTLIKFVLMTNYRKMLSPAKKYFLNGRFLSYSLIHLLGYDTIYLNYALNQNCFCLITFNKQRFTYPPLSPPPPENIVQKYNYKKISNIAWQHVGLIITYWNIIEAWIHFRELYHGFNKVFRLISIY